MLGRFVGLSLAMFVATVVLNLAFLGAAVWLVVYILKSMGVIAP